MYRLTRFTLENRALVGAILAAVTLFLALGVPKVQVVHGFRVLIGEDHPVVETLDSMTERFGGSLPLEIGWACGDGRTCTDALDDVSLDVARSLTDSLEALPFVRRVISPANASLLLPTQDGFVVRKLIEAGAISPDIDDLRRAARSDDLWSDRIVSRDLRAAILIVAPVDDSIETGERLLDAVDTILAPLRDRGLEFHLNGSMVRTVISGRALQASTARVIPALVAVIAFVLLVTSGSPTHVALALSTMGIGVLWTVGLMGWLGWPQDGIHQVLAPLILVVGVCDSVHYLARAATTRGTHIDRLTDAARDVGPACLVTTTTTATALASFVTSDLSCFRRFGMISALGVCACLILSFTLLPLLASTTSRSTTSTPPSPGPLMWLVTFARRASRQWPRVVLASCAVLALFGATGVATRLSIDTDWQQAFGENGDISRWARFFDTARGSSDAIELELEMPESAPVHDRDTIALISKISSDLEKVSGLGKSFGVATLIARLDRILRPDVEPTSRLRDQPVAELLELLSMDDSGSLEPWLTLDRRSTRVSVHADWLAQEQTRSLMRRVRAVIESSLPRDWTYRLSGMRAIDDTWVTEVQSTQLRSFPTALLLVFVLSALFLRSVWLGLIAMVPSALAIVMTLGTMGWLGMGLDIGRAMIGAVVIGIGVDDAIHFLDAYRKQLARGGSREEAVEFAVGHTGRAIVTTSLALAFGFLTLMASAWQTISSFGFFVSITILAALVATLFLLPTLLVIGRPRRADVGDTR